MSRAQDSIRLSESMCLVMLNAMCAEDARLCATDMELSSPYNSRAGDEAGALPLHPARGALP
ncbi:MAG: hypothetical protein ACI4MJ_01235, partial [Aristaeellaceae bacterium]